MAKYTSIDKIPICTQSSYKEECDTIVYGSLAKGLQRLKIWPGDPRVGASSMTTKTVRELYRDLKEIRNYVWPGNGYSSDYHSGCGFTNRLHEAVDRVHQDMSKQILESTRKHLDTQGTKLANSDIIGGNFQEQGAI